MKHVVFFSGGAASWAAAKRVAERHGTADLYLVFTDTRTEDPDLYRFLVQAAENVGGTLVRLSDGRDIWQVFKDERFLGNSFRDPCSKILKRNLSRTWIEANCTPEDTILYLGMDWSEVHRLERSRLAWLPYVVEGPMTEKPYRSKAEMLADLRAEGIDPPRLYDLGFSHNNCGGGCVKAGHGHFLHLLKTLPDVYATWERNEEEVRQHIGADVSILRDRGGNTSTPMTLREFRERQEAAPASEEATLQMALDLGGCACFEAPEDEAVPVPFGMPLPG